MLNWIRNQAQLLKDIGCRLGAMTDKKFAKSATTITMGPNTLQNFQSISAERSTEVLGLCKDFLIDGHCS